MPTQLHAKVGRRPQPTGGGHVIQPQLPPLDQPTSQGHPLGGEPSKRRGTQLGAEPSMQGSRTGRRLKGQTGHRKWLIEPSPSPLEHPSQRGIRNRRNGPFNELPLPPSRCPVNTSRRLTALATSAPWSRWI